MTVFVNDTMTGAEGTGILSHTGELGATWTVHPSYSQDGSLSNANRLITTTNTFVYASGIPGSPNYSVDVAFRAASLASNGAITACGRVDTSANTFYGALYATGDGSWTLYKLVAGTFTPLAYYGQTLVAGSDYTATLDMVGTTIRLLVDGVQRASVTDSSITAAGKAGIRVAYSTNTTGLHIDSVTATDDTAGGGAAEVAALCSRYALNARNAYGLRR